MYSTASFHSVSYYKITIIFQNSEVVQTEAEPSEVDLSKGIEELTMREKCMLEQCSFTKMLERLPSHLSETAVKNLSVPIAFVCLLHLANEKVTQLTVSLSS